MATLGEMGGGYLIGVGCLVGVHQELAQSLLENVNLFKYKQFDALYTEVSVLWIFFTTGLIA